MVGSCSSGQAIRAVQTGRVAWLHTPALHFTLDSPERRKPSRQRNLPTKLSGPEPGAASIHPFSRVGVKHSSNARLREGSRTANVQVLMMASSFFGGLPSSFRFSPFSLTALSGVQITTGQQASEFSWAGYAHIGKRRHLVVGSSANTHCHISTSTCHWRLYLPSVSLHKQGVRRRVVTCKP